MWIHSNHILRLCQKAFCINLAPAYVEDIRFRFDGGIQTWGPHSSFLSAVPYRFLSLKNT